MRLQILVNHYREDQEIVNRFLQSVAGQTGVDHKTDYEVIIGSDGLDNQLDRTFLDGFPFNIRYFAMPHKGTRAMRNTLLDMADADYLMFPDIDDCFTGTDGFSVLLKAANEGNPDIVSVPFWAELKNDDGGGFHYVKYPNNCVWLEGNIFKREYLTANDIRFDEIANYGELYFLWQAFHLTDNIRCLSDCFYTYKWNDKSVTREKPYFKIRNYGRVVESYSRLAQKLSETGRDDLRDELICETVSNAYVSSHSEYWADAPKEYVTTANAALAEYIREWRSVYEAVPERHRKNKYNETLLMKRTYGPPAGFKGIAAWMEALTNE